MDGLTDAVKGRRRSRARDEQLEYVTGVRSADPGSIKGAQSDLLYEAASSLLRAKDRSEVLGMAVRYAARMLQTHIAFVMLLDSSGAFLKLEASMGHRTPTFTTIVRPVQAITAVGIGKPVQSSDFLNDSRLDHDPGTDDIIRKEGMRTVLAVPLQLRDRMLGALYAGHREPRHFPPTEVQEFLELADHVSAAFVRVERLADLTSQSEATSRQLRQSEERLAEWLEAERVRQTLLTRIREQEGVAAATVALAEILDRPILVTDWKLAPIASAGGRSQAAGSKSTAPLHRNEGRLAVAESTESHTTAAAGRDWQVAPIEAGRNLLGYLWIGPAEQATHVANLRMVMEWLSPVMALELFTKGDSDRRQRGDFIHELLAERLPDFTILEARAASFWNHFNQPHRPLILHVTGPEEQWGSRLETARRIIASGRPNDFVAIYGHHVIVLTTPAGHDQVDAATADILQLLERNHLTASAVVGGPCRDLKESREATLAALRLDDLLGAPNVTWAEGLEALTYLFDEEHRERMQTFCRTALAPFGRRDALLDAVHAYYESGGNKANAARRLSIHVNTLRQRIERAEQIVGGSIDDSVRAVPIRLALLVRAVSQLP